MKDRGELKPTLIKRLQVSENRLRREILGISARLEQERKLLADLGLWKTFHKIDDVLKHLGWEVAKILEAMKEPTKKMIDEAVKKVLAEYWEDLKELGEDEEET